MTSFSIASRNFLCDTRRRKPSTKRRSATIAAPTTATSRVTSMSMPPSLKNPTTPSTIGIDIELPHGGRIWLCAAELGGHGHAEDNTGLPVQVQALVGGSLSNAGQGS